MNGQGHLELSPHRSLQPQLDAPAALTELSLPSSFLRVVNMHISLETWGEREVTEKAGFGHSCVFRQLSSNNEWPGSVTIHSDPLPGPQKWQKNKPGLLLPVFCIP